jgi:tetrahydromethanopterin S-methyltransferase subunit F
MNNKEYQKGFEHGIIAGTVIGVIFVFVLLILFPLP